MDTPPENLRLAVEDLGPTFIKLGQLLSTRADLLSPEYEAELTKLLDTAPALPSDVVEDIIERELHAPADTAFATFDAMPLACASVEQAGYVEMALELGIATDRIDTIADFAAIAKYGVKGDGGGAAASAATLAELAAAIAAATSSSRYNARTRSKAFEPRSPSSRPVTWPGRSPLSLTGRASRRPEPRGRPAAGANHRNQAMPTRLIVWDSRRVPADGTQHQPPKGASMTTTTSDPTTTETEDRLAILELTGNLALLLDARDWNALGRLFADPVHYDRTSLFGGEPETLSPAELVEGYRQALGNLDAIHHLITCQVINLDGDQASCVANMQGTHVLANSSGGPMWTVGGRHDYQLKRTADGWKIAGLKFTIQWATGNMHIVALAAAPQ